MIYLARSFGPEAFGIYSLYIIGVTVALGLQAPLIITPLFQIGYSDRFRKSSVWQAAFVSNFTFSGIFSLLVLVFFASFAVLPLLTTFLFAAYVFLSTQIEIIRKILIFLHKDWQCLVFDGLFYLAIAVFLFLMQLGDGVNLQGFLLFFLIPSIFALIIGFFFVCRWAKSGFDHGYLKASREVSKPFILSTGSNLFAGQYFLFILAGLVGVTAVGGFNAVRALVGPLGILLMTTDVLVYRNVAQAHADGLQLKQCFQQLRSEMLPLYFVGVSLLIGSVVLHEEIVLYSYGREYLWTSAFLPLLMFTVIVQIMSKHVSLKLRLKEELDVIKDANFGVLYGSVVLMPPLIAVFGVTGAFIGLLFQQSLLLIFYHFRIKASATLMSWPIWFSFDSSSRHD